jgi:hypothetical protein
LSSPGACLSRTGFSSAVAEIPVNAMNAVMIAIEANRIVTLPKDHFKSQPRGPVGS